ncbi:hypothetical protein [Oryza sativa Japonica Group]|uniref:Uncharacterized protein n=2 Tax=Oryza sativa subsp. japonica TaxID=39947 RepID=Q5N9I1_ORYSJ|nr:hypothetical protein [Oryza sativa Japonica Group]BAD82217.1 hypothetical protein [Oryza sativa Japonica Group]
MTAAGEGNLRNMERRTGWSGWPTGAAPVRFAHHLHLHRCRSRWGKASPLLPVVGRALSPLPLGTTATAWWGRVPLPLLGG